jgi:1,5-anhydro-D-fructose reductase (1,5-anhydro-D-mannitol-forming)
MLNVAMLSKWHVHAEGDAKQIKEYGANITCVWDENAERGAAWAKQLNTEFEPDLDKLLTRTDVDAVACCAPTAMHKEVIVKAANAGKAIFTEKALAPTVAECDEIAEAVNKNHVKFLISMPWRCRPETQYAKKVIEEGLLGDITLIRIRNAHNGATANWLPDYWYDEKMACGGAMMDLGCHPMYGVSYLCGRPKRITSMFNTITGRAVEDNAVNLIEFENKCIAVVETALVSFNSPSCFEVYGTEGTLIERDGSFRLASANLENSGFAPVTDMPKELPSPIVMFLDACTKNTPIEFGLEAARNLSELLEMAYVADKKNTVVGFNEI